MGNVTTAAGGKNRSTRKSASRHGSATTRAPNVDRNPHSSSRTKPSGARGGTPSVPSTRSTMVSSAGALTTGATTSETSNPSQATSATTPNVATPTPSSPQNPLGSGSCPTSHGRATSQPRARKLASSTASTSVGTSA